MGAAGKITVCVVSWLSSYELFPTFDAFRSERTLTARAWLLYPNAAPVPGKESHFQQRG